MNANPDYLDVQNKPDVQRIIENGTFLTPEVVFFSDFVKKINSYSWKSTRVMIITNKRIYDFKVKSKSRSSHIQPRTSAG